MATEFRQCPGSGLFFRAGKELVSGGNGKGKRKRRWVLFYGGEFDGEGRGKKKMKSANTPTLSHYRKWK